LKFGSLSAGLAVLILYPAPNNIAIGVTVSLISVLFYVARNLLIPRARTPGQLDLIVSGYLLPVFFIQWCCILLTPTRETSTGSACMIVISGLLFSRRQKSADRCWPAPGDPLQKNLLSISADWFGK
jgi:hypothetical protein